MKHAQNQPLDWDAIRRRLAEGGQAAWRGLEELAGSEAFAEMLHREFPERAAEWTDPVTRRQFLTLLGASLALAGVAGCSSQPAPEETIVPPARQPEGTLPGKPRYYATAMTLAGVATGLLVKSNEGRPTKVEGNPDHPASLGATDVFAQASVLGLYDPDRSQAVTYLGRPRAFDEALVALRAELAKQRERGGAGLRVLTGNVTSPTLAELLNGDHAGTLRRDFPEAKWYRHEPAHSDNIHEGARLAFGRPADTIYHFENAAVVVSLDADFLGCGPGHLRYVREFMTRRRARPMNRLYAVETMPSSTGAVADNRLPLRPGEIESFARALAAELRVENVRTRSEKWQKWITAVAADLRKNAGKCVIVAGDTQPPIVHALAHAINLKLENGGKTVSYIDPIEARPADHRTELRDLVGEMKAGRVEMLLVLGVNPVFTAAADLEFEKHLQTVPFRVHLGLYQDETAVQCHWHIPEAHYLEAWGDARAYDGTVTIMQPLIAPLYHGRSALELLAALLRSTEYPGYELVRDYWREHWPKNGDRFERAWEKALHDGVIHGSQFERRASLTLQKGWAEQQESRSGGEMEIAFRPDPTIYDGRFANNGWLQELPKPVSKLTWDNAAFVSPATAQKLGLTETFGRNGREHGQAIVDVVELSYDGRTVEAPAWILPGHADDCVTVTFGYGRTRAGRVGNNTGFDAYRLRTSTAPWFASGVRVRKTGRTYTLACTQMHHAMQGRDPVRTGEVEKREHSAENADSRLHPLALYEPPKTPAPNRWGMAIDLAACTGCSACVVACQAENNSPVVGKTEVTRGREMHWLRIDRYYKGGPDNPETYFQPVPCMQCENAPCELVCPVAATAHSADGLNDMVYNRCVGTRYCSNNCPYKVRRFNFLAYADFVTESLKLGRNPDVTVRSRGVMEKCTYCVQRIRTAQIVAEIAGRELADGDVVTACQAACPANAILFGDLNDPKSKVVAAKADARNYSLLEELNTKPRTTYLTAMRNPNPEIE
jgi:molybdopterin-containing oxidoreductase family iron-sulfur binding subunit